MCRDAYPLFLYRKMGKNGIKTKIRGKIRDEYNVPAGWICADRSSSGRCDVDHPISDEIRRESDRIIGKVYIRTMIFDFEATDFMDSSGIGLLMGRYRVLGMRQGCIRAVQVSSHIDKLLHLSGVHKYIEIQKSEGEGMI